MLGRFDPTKTIQAAGVLLKTATPHRMSRLRLLKLLYIADRENIQRIGRSITGDAAVAMDHGPVLSRTYGCIRGGDAATSQWETFIQRNGQWDVELVADPGIGKLSRAEIAKLQEVSDRYAHLEDDYAIALVTHEFPEWIQNKPPQGSARDIPVLDVLQALGMEEEAADLLQEARHYAKMKHLQATTPR